MLIALIVFILLLIAGLYLEELTWKRVGLLVLVAMVAAVLLVILGWPAILYTAVLAILDIMLVIVVFRGNIRI